MTVDNHRDVFHRLMRLEPSLTVLLSARLPVVETPPAEPGEEEYSGYQKDPADT
jgi:hypothetical protein